MKKILKVLKILAYSVIGLLLIFLIVKLGVDRKLPTGKEGILAEMMSKKMLDAIHYGDWTNTGVIEWNYAGRHQILWDKKRNLAEVIWGSKRALIDCSNGSGIAYIDDMRVIDSDDANSICQRAHFIWANDSYWLNPVSKIYDEGVSRSYVDEDGFRGLLVSYAQGGYTPGDSYLWVIDKNGLPVEWYMWVKIIPFNGLKATWENWVETETGALISTKHQIGPMTTEISDLRTAHDLNELRDDDVFSELMN